MMRLPAVWKSARLSSPTQAATMPPGGKPPTEAGPAARCTMTEVTDRNPAPEVPNEMRATIEASLIDGRLPCKTAWDIATKFSCSRLSVSAAAEALKIRIIECQLSCF